MIYTKTNASLEPKSILPEIDQHCQHNNWFVDSALAKSLTFYTYDFCDNSVKKT